MSWNMAAYEAGKTEARAFRHSTVDEIRERVLRDESVSEFGLGLTHGAVQVLTEQGYEIEAAKVLIEREMDGPALSAVTRLLGEEMAIWRVDPHVDRVVGLCGTDSGPIGHNSAYVVVYLDGTTPDWETSMAFEDAKEGRI